MKKLYYDDQYISKFDAKIIDATEKDGAWHIVLDQTAFYPGGGGQPCDIGIIDDKCVTECYEMGGQIFHIMPKKPANDNVQAEIDFKRRYAFMQNHCGEHILSGLAESLFDAQNVGFHMSEKGFTMDLTKPLSHEQISQLEQAANAVVAQGLPVEQTFKKGADIATDDFRSKKQFADDDVVRFVTINGVDTCACAALHVKNTLAVGIIKIVSVQKYKKGVRLTVFCGVDAYFDYTSKNDICKTVSEILSADTKSIVAALQKLVDSKTAIQKRAGQLQNQIFELHAQSIAPNTKLAYAIQNEIDVPDMRRFATLMAEHAEIAVVFGGQDGLYKYAICTKQSAYFSEFVAQFNTALSGSGGSSATMATGVCKTNLDDVLTYLNNKTGVSICQM